MGESQGDAKVLVMTGERGERERDAMKDTVRQAEGQRERVEGWEKNSSAMEDENEETM